MIPNDYDWVDGSLLTLWVRLRRHADSSWKSSSIKGLVRALRNLAHQSLSLNFLGWLPIRPLPTQAPKKTTFRVTNYDPLAIIRVVEILNYSRFTFAYAERLKWCLRLILRPKHETSTSSRKNRNLHNRQQIGLLCTTIVFLAHFPSIVNNRLVASLEVESERFRHN